MRTRIRCCIGQWLLLAVTGLLLSACKGGVLDPKGQIGADEKTLIITATVLMLLVVIPVIVLTFLFAWKYRASNKMATYKPKWAHSYKIEAVVWLIPCAIITVLATLTWVTTHELDPYRPLDSDKKPMTIQVVALNWKWLFIYPELNIATVNQIAFPVDVPLHFNITSATVMNSFFIPQLGSQIYAMSGMRTKLNLIANEPGVYEGYSANYSGAGFSGMKFKAKALATHEEFDAWVQKVRVSTNTLDKDSYATLAKPSENHPVEYFSSVSSHFFDSIVHQHMPGPLEKPQLLSETRRE